MNFMPESLQFEWLAEQLSLHPWLSTELFGNRIAHYLAIALGVTLIYLAARTSRYLIQNHAKKISEKTENKVDDVILNILYRSVSFVLVLMTLYFGIESLTLSPEVEFYVGRGIFILLTLKITKELTHFSEFVMNIYLKPYGQRQEKGLSKTLIPPLVRINKLVLWALAILLIISNLGYDINSLIAGLGIGGLALALAAQETLSNVFGSLSILADQPFRVGDWVEVEGRKGTVMEIGMRSTKIQTVNKSVVSIPNKTVAGAVVENVSRRDMMNVEQILGFRYDTSTETLRQLLKTLEQILRRDPDVDKETIRVRFINFGNSSLEIQMFYYITDKSSYARMLEIRERINLKIKEKTEKLGAEMAFPTQTLNLEHADNFFKTPRSKKTN
jgi:MscS family membrane protein